MPQYDPKHTEYSHSRDGGYGRGRELSIKDAPCVFNDRKTQKQPYHHVCGKRKKKLIITVQFPITLSVTWAINEDEAEGNFVVIQHHCFSHVKHVVLKF